MRASTGSEACAPSLRGAIRRALLAVALVAIALTATALAQPADGVDAADDPLQFLLAAAPEHPSVRAAMAALEAAEANLRAARSPIQFDVNSSLKQLDVDDIDL